MSFIAKSAFEARITNNEFNDLINIAGKYKASGSFADCSAGFLCVRNTKLACEGFSGVYNENTWEMNAAVDTTKASAVIYACNPYESALAAVGSNNYFIGSELLSVGVPAGRYGTFTKIVFDNEHVYRFGEGNLSSAISTNTFFTIDDGLLVPAASAPATAGTPYFSLRGTGKFVTGTTENVTYYDVVACVA